MVGNTPTIGATEQCITSQWSGVKKQKVLFHNDGYFVILLNNNEERDEVLMNGHTPSIAKLSSFDHGW